MKTIPKTCQICGKTFQARFDHVQRGYGKYCSMPCYREARRTDAVSRFWAHVDMSGGADACWHWSGSISAAGYGVLMIHGKQLGAHRFSYSLAHGPIPNGLFVCHTCDNRVCVNPAHMFLGTSKDNMQDAARKGRTLSGDKHPSHIHPDRVLRGEDSHYAKLTSAQVLAIRKAYREGIYQRALAEQYGVDRTTIGAIVNYRNWKHI